MNRDKTAHLAHVANSSDTQTVDAVRPVLVSASATGAELVPTYNEALAAMPLPAASAFRIRDEGSSRSVSATAVNGRTVTLMLASAVEPWHKVDVSYAKHSTNPIQDLMGNDADSFTGESAGAQTVTIETRQRQVAVGELAHFTLRRTGRALDALRIDFQVAGVQDRPTSNAHYAVVFHRGQSERLMRIPVGPEAGTNGATHIVARLVDVRDGGAYSNIFRAGSPSTARVALVDGLPQVTVEAPVDTVAEGRPARFTVWRTGFNAQAGNPWLSEPLEVRVRVNATGDMLKNEPVVTVTIPTNRVWGSLLLTTVDDSEVERDARITVRVLSGDGYEVGTSRTVQPTASGTASLVVEDNDDMTLPAQSAPTVTSASVASAPGSGGGFDGGERIEARVSFDGPVVVDSAGGTPRLGMTLDGKRREAAYAGGSGTATLVFALVVAEADAGAPSARIIANGLRRNGATIRGEDGTDAVLAFGAAPDIAAVAIGADAGDDGAWSAGEAVEVTLTFAEPVAVETAGGTPSVGLVLGAGERQAIYARGSGTAALTFAYTVMQDDGAVSSVLVPANGLALNGGAIRSTTGLDAGLAHSGAARTGVVRAPLPALAVADAQAPEGGTLAFRVTLSPAASAPVTVAYPSADGSAAAGADYEAASGMLTFAAGETKKTVAVAALTDDAGESAETLTLTLSNPTGATLGDPQATGTIAKSAGAVPLTASFFSVPPEHDGSTAFRLSLVFSEEPRGLSYRTVRDRLFAVTGAKVRKARRLAPPSNQRYELRVVPSSDAPVTFRLAALPACGASGSVCTADGRALSGPLSKTVPGPAALVVADATVREGPGATLAFAVTLDRARHAPVSVRYATSDGTATAGKDYSAASGTLTFAAGERAKTVEVAVLDDAHDEGSETLTLTLSNASGARIADATAMGTIVNRDPLPKAWMVRFGRTVGSQVVEGLTGRLEGGSGSHVTVGGIELTGGAAFVEPEPPSGHILGLTEWTTGTEREPQARTMTADELLLGSAFHLSSAGAETGGPTFTAWGRIATGGFDAEVDDVSTDNGGTAGLEGAIDGDVTTGLIGFDAEWDRALAGLMLSQSTGEGSYRLGQGEGQAGTQEGTVESTLTGVYPYASMDIDPRISAWAIAGLGSGELTLKPTGMDPMPTDLSMRMGAVGVKGRVLDGGAGGLTLNVRSDALWVSMENDATDQLAGTEGDVSRLRLILEGERAFEVNEGATFTPSAEVGVRHDGGDAETGTGLEVGAGVRYTAGALTVEGRVRALVAHEDSGYEEWGASGAIHITPSPSGRGLALRLSPTWGRTGSGTGQLWSGAHASGLDRGGNDFEAQSGLDAELGYGFGLTGARDVLTPYAGLSLGDAGSRRIRVGTQWHLAPEATVTLEATREDRRDEAPADALMLRGRLRF